MFKPNYISTFYEHYESAFLKVTGSQAEKVKEGVRVKHRKSRKVSVQHGYFANGKTRNKEHSQRFIPTGKEKLVKDADDEDVMIV